MSTEKKLPQRGRVVQRGQRGEGEEKEKEREINEGEKTGTYLEANVTLL